MTHERTHGRKVESSAVSCLSRIRNYHLPTDMKNYHGGKKALVVSSIEFIVMTSLAKLRCGVWERCRAIFGRKTQEGLHGENRQALVKTRPNEPR